MVVLTVIEEEFDAVRQALDAEHEVGATSVYCSIEVQGDPPQVPFVVARCANRSNMPALDDARKALEDWRPEVLVLAGIAGGIVRPEPAEAGFEWVGADPGDVIIAEYVHYAEFTKNVPAGSKLRYFPLDQPTSSLVQAHGDALRLAGIGQDPWHATVGAARPQPGDPQVHVGEIVAVEGIAGDPLDVRQKTYLARFDRAIGIDMESAGVARALHAARTDVHYNPRWMCIRVVSDRVPAALTDAHVAGLPPVENDAERDLWKAYATAALGVITRRLLARLLVDPRQNAPADPGAEAFVL